MDLIFATNNPHKLQEIREAAGNHINILSLADMKINAEIPEDHETLEDNSYQKAEFINNLTGKNCFADDTGLEVDVLNGEPGVYSARYSRIGNPVFPEMDIVAGNIKKLLFKMEGETNRKARFRTVVSLILNKERFGFEVVFNGQILKLETGKEGFGYDPVFQPDGYTKSFAEMTLEEKNQISHRARAIKKLVDFLQSRDNKD